MSSNLADKALVIKMTLVMRRLVKRYCYLSSMEDPNWLASEELPVKDAKGLIKGERPSELEKEYRDLRKLRKEVIKSTDKKDRSDRLNDLIANTTSKNI